MNLAALIGVAVGLAFVYLLLSLICSTIQEWIAAILGRRAATLREGLLALLQDQNKVNGLYSHPLIQSLVPPKHTANASKRLAYLPSSAFATALLETVVPQALTPGANLSQAITNAPLPAHLKASLMALAERAGADRDKFIAAVEKWFDDTMDRVSGWYKRRTQVAIVLIAIVTTLVLNVDTVHLARELYRNAGLREAVNAAANEYLAANPQRPPDSRVPQGAASTNTVADVPAASATSTTTAENSVPATLTTTTQSPAASKGGASQSQAKAAADDKEYRARIQAYLNQLTTLKLPIGWPTSSPGFPILGWLLTTIAISLGAPFWFDVLIRVANLRANGLKPPRSSGD